MVPHAKRQSRQSIQPAASRLAVALMAAAFALPAAAQAQARSEWITLGTGGGPVSGWNGKFEQVGNGSLAGTIPLFAMAEPLLRGFATAGTDDGHTGAPTDGSWAIGHPEKVIDFGYRAVHETSVQAKAILRGFYGKDPAESYFVGCSDGGREALMEAQRFPADFHGIVAGAPANSWTHLVFRGEQNQRAMVDTASYIPPGKLAVLQAAALAQCDALDGVKDGLIQNPRACRFDPAVVLCKDADSPECLTAAQVEAAKKIYGPVIDSRTGDAPGVDSAQIKVPIKRIPLVCELRVLWVANMWQPFSSQKTIAKKGRLSATPF